MITSQIYSEFRDGNTSFSRTLNLLQRLLSERLNDQYTKIWVQGSNSGRVRLCFTVFNTNRKYSMYTYDLKNFRNWRPDGNLESEIVSIENMIENIRINLLQNILVS